ncbi:MAG: acetyl-CoA carboxylase biotin carboxyl carrier protein [Candidatus Jettenia sp.]|uniref:Biotin carboxyl carrier protein of acetyl-CoA carboxylase n=1 Tax=Candidatus Jettenia caeni TaxID=247490 RepID=I3IPW2_9BACT|nr:acetyl-CoA carboxylase biotin carboxyl carrier protein [Candidatus Jettenia sp. AMX1]MBC6928981.1 acetyl-CoA carboxylase biotin carboxyl carrier protein [Candidatus Jettenia sp.]NUN23156.1 acetyl-CoA carboxylase biotin carboxyl carrier protein [Candidatus Jettenia caeni]KAA0250351.1 MAG: acetyl-CoA carboxylase biotin carboxyl carrier protein [Candidatus Jettenia sp. AMX1]MCE7880882.1 acetyl-CoA carboxylase biotin carboxyl carrier protein [Candidatus Jettenia sp. AMX1]MCQ3926973.1 acetyl-CoA
MSIIDKVKQLISIMNENELSEIEIQEDVTKIRIKKREGGYVPAISSVTASPIHPAKIEQEHSSYVLSKESENFVDIISPMVGTFYRSSSPGADPCINVGDTVNEETVVCIIEAMKIMNEVKAETVGEIVDVYANDGEAVEFGQPLFRVKPSTRTA